MWGPGTDSPGPNGPVAGVPGVANSDPESPGCASIDPPMATGGGAAKAIRGSTGADMRRTGEAISRELWTAWTGVPRGVTLCSTGVLWPGIGEGVMTGVMATG